jgi:hypothetical protein
LEALEESVGIRGRLFLILPLSLAGSTGHAQVPASRDLASLVQAIDLALPASADALG